jgi:hypothetical protein
MTEHAAEKSLNLLDFFHPRALARLLRSTRRRKRSVVYMIYTTSKKPERKLFLRE